jgi:2-polyprenyl-6-methoxyphenol hydroxylase-like FAD-dependent oxidoreductase
MAAFAAMREGASVRIFEKSAFPRHKVCGEFLSPAILPLLRRAGCEAGFLQLRPAVLSAMRLHFGTRVIRIRMHAEALSVNRWYALTTANYEPVLMEGALRGGNTTKSLATVTWNEMPPR